MVALEEFSPKLRRRRLCNILARFRRLRAEPVTPHLDIFVEALAILTIPVMSQECESEQEARHLPLCATVYSVTVGWASGRRVAGSVALARADSDPVASKNRYSCHHSA